MARVITAAERATIASLRPWHWVKLEVTDSLGVFQDYTANLRNVDWVNSITLSESIEQNTLTLNASLLRNTQTLSLAPFRSDSLLNQVSGSYATLLDLWRKWKISVAAMNQGYPPTGADWKEIGQGRVDVIDVKDPQPEILVIGRGEEAVLLDRWIDTERQYGSVAGVAMETVIQSMLDDNLGAGVVTLSTPVSPSYLMNTWTQPKGNLFPALVAVAEKAGFIIRYRYNSSNQFLLTLFKPNRTASSEDWSLGPSEYTAVPLNRIDLSGVRNFIKLRYIDPTLGIQTVIYPHMAGTGTVTCAAGAATFSSSQAGILQNGANIIVAGIAYTVSAFSGTTTCTLLSQLSSGGVPTFAASAFTAHGTLSGAGATTSIARFGRRDMEIDLSFSTQVNSGTKAQGMADAVGSDMEFPNLEQQFETLCPWFVQLHDYGRFYANGVHYDTDQLAGVTSISYQMGNGTIKGTLGVRGKPAGAYTNWRVLSQFTVPIIEPGYPYKREKLWNDGKYATQATDTSGSVMDPSVKQSLAGNARAIAKGYQSGYVKDAGVVTFNPVYQNIPQILMRGGKAANATHPYDDFAAVSASASGFTCKAQNKDKGTITAQTAEFTATLLVSVAGDTVGPATIGATKAYDDTYTARFEVTATITLTSGGGHTDVVVAIETNDGVSGWIERATRSFTATRTSAGTTTTTFTAQQVAVTDSTLGAADQVRLKLKSITVSGPGGTSGSATLEGYNNSPGAEGHGLLYNTSSGPVTESKTPDADDYIFWEAFEVVS